MIILGNIITTIFRKNYMLHNINVTNGLKIDLKTRPKVKQSRIFAKKYLFRWNCFLEQ